MSKWLSFKKASTTCDMGQKYWTVFYEFLKCGLYNTYNTYNTFCLIQWTNVRAHDRWAVSANCLRRFGPVRDIRFVKLVPHCVLLRTHDGRWCNGRWCRMVPTVDWQFNAGCAVRSLQLAATSCSLQHAQLYSCTHGRVLYVVLYIRIIQTFYTHSSIGLRDQAARPRERCRGLGF
jgi:hypothetical protein